MKALFYLIRKRLKNTLINMLKNPGQLIFILVIVGLLALNIVTSGLEPTPADIYRNPAELYAIVFAFYVLIFVLSILPGFKNGATFFSLSDVNIVFTAPISAKRILVYGMVRQLGMSLFAGFFILYQYGWMRTSYGVTGWALGAILLGYALTMFCGQLVAMLIYSRTARDENKQKRIKNIAVSIGLALAVLLLLPLFSNGLPDGGFEGILATLVESINRPFVHFIPIIGWLTALVQGAFSGSYLMVALSAAATAGFIVLFVWIIGLVDSDYYEDVLAATEISHSAVAAKKEGRNTEAIPQNVKVGAEGLKGGEGASAFYYKHEIENRRGRVLLFDTTSLIFMAVSIGFAYLMREFGTLPGVVFSVYMLIFSSFTGRWAKELLLPYVYMVPQPPFRKLVMILGETFKKNLIESAVVGVGIGLVTGALVIEIIAVVVVRFACSVLFIAATILSERLFGGLTIRWMQMTFLILTLLICMVPSITVGILVGVHFDAAIGYLAAAACGLALSALILYLCRNILAIAELNTR